MPIATICDKISPIKAISEGVGLNFSTESIDNKTAEKLVRKWQKAKAAAMGKRHNVAALGDVLTGQMLAQWEGRAMVIDSSS